MTTCIESSPPFILTQTTSIKQCKDYISRLSVQDIRNSLPIGTPISSTTLLKGKAHATLAYLSQKAGDKTSDTKYYRTALKNYFLAQDFFDSKYDLSKHIQEVENKIPLKELDKFFTQMENAYRKKKPTHLSSEEALKRCAKIVKIQQHILFIKTRKSLLT